MKSKPRLAVKLSGIEKGRFSFEDEEIYLPQLILTGEAMKQVMKILDLVLKEKDLASEKAGKSDINIVEGDMHDIEGEITASLLSASGFKVIDLFYRWMLRRHRNEYCKNTAKCIGGCDNYRSQQSIVGGERFAVRRGFEIRREV